MNTAHQSTPPPSPAPTAPKTVRAVWIIAVVALIAAVIAYPFLPDPMPTHWGINGQVNGWSPKWLGTFLVPGMIALFAVLFPLLERIDPKREHYALFRKPWIAIQISLATFLLFMEGIIFYASLVPARNDFVGTGVTAGIGVLFIILGNYMGKIRQNWFVGLRTPWTLEDPEIWQKSQRLTGWMFVLGGIVILISALTLGKWVWVPFVFVVPPTAIVPIVYSYVLATRKRRNASQKQ